MPTTTITKQQALDIIYGEEGRIIREQITGHSRWSIITEVIFKLDGEDKLWRLTYSKGATEMQDESPFEYEDTITCKEVKTVASIDYEIIKDA